MRFVLKIDLGNAAMSSGADIADALSRLTTAMSVADHSAEDLHALATRGHVGPIRDGNGNRVGFWTVEPEGA